MITRVKFFALLLKQSLTRIPVMSLNDEINILNGRMNKFYYTLFNIIAITVIIYLGVDSFYRVIRMKYTEVDIKTFNSPVIEEETSSLRSSVNDYRTIIDRSIFSKINVPAQSGDIIIDDLDSTSLKLVLIGTIAGNKETSAAIIQDTSTRPKTQGLYRIGDTIQHAEIKSIVRKNVVLRVGNRDEVLTMEESESSGTVTSQAETVAQAAPTTTTAVIERNINLKREYIEESLKDLNGLLSQASIRPHSTDGEADGLTITGIKAGSIFRRMGLRNGDIIQGVNNNTIQTTEDIMNMYNDLISAPEISLQITRRNQARSFNYTITD